MLKRVFFILAIPAALVFFKAQAEGGVVPLGIGGTRAEAGVRSFQELRQTNVVKQRWDMSCGAAALSTLLTYHYNDPVPESEIIIGILKTTDPMKVRARGGFSLMDLKKFTDRYGYKGAGYAELTLDDLTGFKTPAIIPVNIKNYDHFVVFRGAYGDRVLFSDPVYGAVSMQKKRFLEIWKNGIGFFLKKEGAELPGGLLPSAEDFLVTDGAALRRAVSGIRPDPPTRHGP